MTTAIIANLESLLNGPRDGGLLRYSLGNEYLKAGQPAKAVERFREAIARDANFSAAWKLLGKALAENGEIETALDAYAQGIRVAEAKGDLQAVKEMTVFAKKLRKQREENAP
jgi:predicted Zn-dependent protease